MIARLRELARPERFLALIWLMVLVRIAWPEAEIRGLATGLMAAFVILSLARLRRQTVILISVLATITVLLAIVFEAWGEVVRGVEGATVFAAFFGTIMMLRATAERRPETVSARDQFERLDAGQQSGAFLIAAHAIGALLVVGAMAVLAPIQGADANDVERRRAAEVCLRGMCLAPLWSPFWIAMALSYQHLPLVPLWQVMALGVPLAAAGLALCHLMYARETGLRGLGRAVWALRPIIAPVGLCALTVAVVTSLTALSTIQSVAVAMPVLCGAALLAQGRQALRSALRDTYRGVGAVTDEVVLLTVALALGRVLERALDAIGTTDAIAALDPQPAVLIAAVIVAMTLAGIAGIHQVVSITVVLVVAAPLPSGLADVVLMESALIGWAFASMSGISAVSVAVAASMFRVPMERLVFGPNLKLVVAYGLLAIACLAAVQAVVFGN